METLGINEKYMSEESVSDETVIDIIRKLKIISL